MQRLLKTSAATAATLGPLLLALFAPTDWARTAIIVYLLLAFWVFYVFVFNREDRLPIIRNAELDVLFDEVFSDYEADLTRFPFRVHVFRRFGMFPVETLSMIYSYRTHTTDPDRAISFRRYFGNPGQGLVWQTCENGDVRFFRSGEVPDAKSEFHLRDSQATATRDVAAILTFPMRRMTGHKNDLSANSSPIGVLALDALNAEAAESLQQMFDRFRAGQEPAIADLIDRVSLYV